MRIAGLAGLVVGGLLAAGCGGGGGDRLSEEEFREQANAICEEYDQKIAALGSPTSPEDIPAFVEKGIPLIEQGLAELRDLNPPEELQEDYDRMLDETEKAIPAARKLSEAAAEEDAAAVQEAIAEGQQADTESDRIATELGLNGCVSE
jgi:flagellar hook-length control protein FliK